MSRGVAKGDGTSNPSVSLRQREQEVSGEQPTGHVFVYPQLAGYMKQQMLSISTAIRHAGMPLPSFQARQTSNAVVSVHGKQRFCKSNYIYK